MTLSRTAVVRPLLVALVAGTVPVAAASGTASAAAPCRITWGSLEKSSATAVEGPITSVRSGRHPCYDRLVVDVSGQAPGYTV